MLTIFTIPKPFTDPHIRLIQRNAILSWKKINPDIEIFLMGNDPGVKETAAEFGVRHVPEVAVNEFGTPLLDRAFSLAQQNARYETVMYANCDIIFLGDFAENFPNLPKNDFLVIGRRTDLDVDYEIDFSDPAWRDKIWAETQKKGKLHSWAGIDYFIFNKNSFKNLPPFAVGRVGWDNWTVRESRRAHTYTIDATQDITAIHQNHGYTGTNTGSLRKTNPEAQKNNSYTKRPADAFTIEDADWKLVHGKLKRNYLFWIPYFKRYVKSLL